MRGIVAVFANMSLAIDESSILGQGFYGRVYHGALDSECVAAKKALNGASVTEESRLLELCDHRNVVKYRGLLETGHHNEYFLVMELAQGGTLKDHLGANLFSFNEKRLLLQQICSGLEHIHSRNILHRDIKAENLLFRDLHRRHVLIADFGGAEMYQENVRKINTHDVVQDHEYTFKSDVFLLGLVTYQTFEDLQHVDRLTLAGRVLRRHRKTPIADPGIYTARIWRTIIQSLDWRSERRPTASEFNEAFADAAA
ncbi:calmodulin-binding receptor-like cytoplasmic kinase 3 [Galendromus occidentalis]|uniref:Calmodulin-binding receptor-like cytoplasmic kinase 3 n=1 Tax=Galendromus occidentalis TaxID=34638 RepID=A0AAJ6QSR1_9ACAR|nr:calmodulin-binding receptor-like cytoplasmic kinase 3 [Galendromus occidentalis]